MRLVTDPALISDDVAMAEVVFLPDAPARPRSLLRGIAATFGVVSLVGGQQALKIDSILMQHMDPADYKRREILCGDSAQFQGDERDVMFLTVVDSPPEKPPHPMRQEGPKKIFKKRFNVAASRARRMRASDQSSARACLRRSSRCS